MIWVTGAMKKTLDEDNKSTETYAFLFSSFPHTWRLYLCAKYGN